MGVRRTRNDRPFWYCRFKTDRKPGDAAIAGIAVSGITVVGDSEENINYVIDEYGHQTGERILTYYDPVACFANISPASGQTGAEIFGSLEGYDKVLVTRDMDCPIDENTVLFIDKEPEYAEVQTYELDDESDQDTMVLKTYRQPMNDYIVKRVAKSLNVISIAIRKVEVG